MRIERKELQDRQNGELAKVLNGARADESQQELDRLAREDQQKAEEGLVELREEGHSYYKHIDELTREDRPARIEAQRRRLEWIQQRLKGISADAHSQAALNTADQDDTDLGTHSEGGRK